MFAQQGFRRSTVASLVVLCLAAAGLVGLVGVVSVSRAFAAGTLVGFAIPMADGSSGGWIGSYRVGSQQVYCADPMRDGPSTTSGYSAPTSVSTWRKLNGDRVPRAALRRVAYVLSAHGVTSSRVPAAAVDSIVYGLTAGGTYRIGGDRWSQRLRESGHATEIRRLVDAWLDESRRYAGPYHVEVSAPTTPVDGSIVVTASLVSASGRAVPGIPFTLTYDGVTKDATSGPSGEVTASFAAVSAGRRRATAATDAAPTTRITFRSPSEADAQRVFIGGATDHAAGHTPVLVTKARPHVQTTASAQVALPGAALTDTVDVTGTAHSYDATMTATLYGPFDRQPGHRACVDTVLAGRVTVRVRGDGTYVTPSVTAPLPGIYTWVEHLPGSADQQAATTACGKVVETTTISRAQPSFITTISRQQAVVGHSVHDAISVSGLLDGHPLPIRWSLFGPYDERPGASACLARDLVAHGVVTASGNGQLVTRAVMLRASGFYTYAETSARSAVYEAAQAPCGVVTETTLARSKPHLHTETSQQTARVGSRLFDTVEVTGLGNEQARMRVELYGPAGAQHRIACDSKPVAVRVVRLHGDGTYRTPQVRIDTAGWYGWAESIAGGPRHDSIHTSCRVPAETTKVMRHRYHHPEVPTGPATDGWTPDRSRPQGKDSASVRVPSLGINATMASVGTHAGEMSVPHDVHRVGWLRLSATTADRLGALVVAGHVSDDHDRPGALYRLADIDHGARILVRVAGQTEMFRVTGTAYYSRERALPSRVFDVAGRHVLELVTCGHKVTHSDGTFHYRDNLVVTARPVSPQR